MAIFDSLFDPLFEMEWPVENGFTVVQLGLLAISFIVGIWLVQPTKTPYRDFSRVPRALLPARWAPPIERSLQLGYFLYTRQGRSFTMKVWNRDHLVLPPQSLQDLQSAPNLTASFHNEWHHLTKDQTTLLRAVCQQLNSPQVTVAINEDFEMAMKDWVGSVPVALGHNTSLLCSKLTHRMISRFMLSTSLSRNKKFVKETIDTHQSLTLADSILDYVPLGPLRNIFTDLIRNWRQLSLRSLAKKVQPEFHQAITKSKSDKSQTSDQDLDGLSLLHSQIQNTGSDSYGIARDLIQVCVAGSGSSAALLTNMIHQILVFPRYTESLRTEAKRATDEHGWTEKAIQNMPLLDSFIRELNRVTPGFSVVCSRTVQEKPWKLSSGLALPIGTRCVWPGKDIMRDPEYYDDPQTFNGSRFFDLAKETTQYRMSNNKYGAGSVGTTNLAFGFGPNACPGRFFALQIVKVLFVRLILQYDIEWLKAQETRPQDIETEGHYYPNSHTKIKLKERKESTA